MHLSVKVGLLDTISKPIIGIDQTHAHADGKIRICGVDGRHGHENIALTDLPSLELF